LSEAVTGTIFINLPKKNGNKVIVDELKIYNRYNKIYPNLNIEYGNDMEKIEASTIEFFNIDESTVTDVSKFVPYCTILFNGKGNTYSLADLINKSTTFKNPSKSSTPQKEFIFEGEWRDAT
jgi:hypothetical protein